MKNAPSHLLPQAFLIESHKDEDLPSREIDLWEETENGTLAITYNGKLVARFFNHSCRQAAFVRFQKLVKGEPV